MELLDIKNVYDVYVCMHLIQCKMLNIHACIADVRELISKARWVDWEHDGTAARSCREQISLSQHISEEKMQLILLKIGSSQFLFIRFIYNEWFPALLQQNVLWLQYWAAAMEQL